MSDFALREYKDVCEALYELMLDENRHLKSGKGEIGGDMVERKRVLLERLDAGVKGLKEMNAKGVVEGVERKEILAAVKKRMMKIFLLEKENEQLMLKNDFRSQAEALAMPVIKKRVRDVYGDVVD